MEIKLSGIKNIGNDLNKYVYGNNKNNLLLGLRDKDILITDLDFIDIKQQEFITDSISLIETQQLFNELQNNDNSTSDLPDDSNSDSSNLNELVYEAITSSQSLLTDFGLNPLFDNNLGLIFGENIDPKKAQKIRQQWIKGIFEDSPEIEIVPKADLNNANGAYATQLNKIFLAEEFLQANSTNLTAIIDLYLEEFGHFVDSQINKSEAPGDEGRIFAELVQGKELNESIFQNLKIEDDWNIFNLDSQHLQAEQNTPMSSNYDDIEISFRAFIPSPAVSLSSDGAIPFSGIFGGDNRSFQYGGTNIIFSEPPISSRAYQSVVVTVDPEQESSFVIEPFTIWGETTEYSSDDINSVSDQPFWWVEPKLDASPTARDTLQVNEDNNHIEVERISDNEIEVKFLIDGGIPLLPHAPNIDADFSVFIRQEEGQLPFYRIEGSHDGFPAYELYINKVRVYEHDPVARNQNPFSLFPPAEWDFPNEGFQVIPGVNLPTFDAQNLNQLFSTFDTAQSSVDSLPSLPFIGSINESSSQSANFSNLSLSTQSFANIANQFSLSTSFTINESDNPFNFFGNIKNALLQELGSLEGEVNILFLQQAFFDVLGPGNLNVLKDLNEDSRITKEDVGLTIGADEVRFDLSLGSETSFFERSIQGDFGLPYLGLTIGEDANSQVKLGLGYEFNFSFGINSGGFFLDTPSDEDIKVSLEASIPDLDLQGQIGFLQANVKDEDTDENENNDGIDVDSDEIKPSFFEVGVAVDLEGSTIKNIEQVGTGELNLNLIGSLGGIDYLPSIDSDLNIIWNDLINGSPEIAFNNVTLDLGSFFKKFIDPVFEPIDTITKPLGKVTNVINQDLPLIGISLLDFAEFVPNAYLDPATKKFIETFEQISEIIEIVDSIPDSSRINLGSFQVGNVDTGSNSLINTTILNPTSPNPSELETQIGQQSEQHNQFITIAENPNLEFPIVTEPTTAFNLLLGKPADLFQLNLGTIGFGFDYEAPPIPIFGPVVFDLGVAGAAAANLSIGFDTYGLEQFRDTGDASQLSQGLYFTTSEIGTPPFPLPPDEDHTVGVGALAEAGVGLNFGPISASFLGGINGNLFLDLAEERTRVQDFAHPGCVLELAGALDFILSLKLKLGFGPFSISKRIGLLRETLADFSAGCSGHGEDIGQATKEEDGILILSVGDEAKNLDVEEIKEDELITVNHSGGTFGNESLRVITHGTMQTYNEIRKIVGDAKDGNDIIQLGENVLTPASLQGGNGDDDITGGRGDDTIKGGNDSDALLGGQGNDSILGENGDDYLYGEEGDDTLDGGDGEDIVSYATASSAVDINSSLGEDSYARDGEGGNDFLISIEQIEGSAHNDTIVGSDDEDRIDGGDGDDIISGGADDDFLMGGNGSDTLNGGDGQDATTYAGAFANVYIDLENDFVFDGDGSIDVLISVESVQASSYDDMVIGDSGDNLLDASDGDDTVIGSAGNDTLDGGGIRDSLLNDQFIDEPGIDWLSYIPSPSGVNVSLKDGKAYNDGFGYTDELKRAKKLTSNSPDDEPSSSNTQYSSFENLRGSNHSDSLLEGDIGDNRIEGLDGDDTLKGSDGEDTLVGDHGADNLDGGDDDDLADYSLSTDYVIVNLAAGVGFNGHAEGDTFVQSGGQATVENLLGSRYGDTLVGDDGDNEINPGLSNGYFAESQGQIDYVFGGNGSDLLIIDYSRQDYRGTGITGGFSSDFATSGFLSRRNLNNNEIIQDAVSFGSIDRSYIIGTIKDDQFNGGVGNDKLLLGAGNDTINGGAGDDDIRGDDGNDLLIGGAGADELNGGAGRDKASYFTSNGGVNVNLINSSLIPQNSSHAEGDKLFSIEDLEGSNYADTLTGNAQANYIEGLNGSDVLIGGVGNDTVSGGSGDDFLNGDIGADSLDGGEGIDRASYENSLQAITVNLKTGIGIGGDAEGDSLKNIEELRGSNHNDLLEGDTNNNVLFGEDGADTLLGDGGNDYLYGDEGNDSLFGNAGNDDLYGHKGIDSLQGNAGNDWLFGDEDNDSLFGGDGNDTLVGSFGLSADIDTLTGGTGADQFWLGDANADYYSDQVTEYAIITDFNLNEPNEGDKIQLHRCSRDYELKEISGGVGIYSDFDNNLIGVLQGLSLSEVNKTDDFIYLQQNCSSILI